MTKSEEASIVELTKLGMELAELRAENRLLREFGSNYVPWQCCPVCNGRGEVMINDVYTTYQYQVCPTCLGKRIILMHKP